MTVRTRFAPSPTGMLHIGGARTALFSWLYAKKMQGQFLLRIEDTDRERSTKEAIDAIFSGMDWLGLHSDEEVQYQTQRFNRYHEVIQQLLTEGHAYYCNCSKERLEKLREEQMQQKQKPRYDHYCRDKNLTAEESNCVVRFKNPLEGTVVFEDKVYGKIEVNNKELDDLIIARSDGSPTYNFCVVVDDWDMKISHVIRGDDHINNTPRQINILKALNAPIPVYAHVPMILGEDGKKLSKREGAVGVMYYRDLGILPEAMLNFLVRLGWSYGDQELFSAEEMISLFDIKNLNKSAAALNLEKLLWINQHYLKTLSTDYIQEQLQWHLLEQEIDLNNGPDIVEIIELMRGRVQTLKELVEKLKFFYSEVNEYDEKAKAKFFTEEGKSVLQSCFKLFAELENWDKDAIKASIQALLKENGLKMPQLAQPLRIALTGNTLSPSIDVTVFYIGREKVLKRIEKALDEMA